jgi:hypothetical protein
MFYIFTIREPYLTSEAKALQKDFKAKQQGDYLKEKEEKKSRQSMLSHAIKYWYNWL